MHVLRLPSFRGLKTRGLVLSIVLGYEAHKKGSTQTAHILSHQEVDVFTNNSSNNNSNSVYLLLDDPEYLLLLHLHQLPGGRHIRSLQGTLLIYQMSLDEERLEQI